MTILLNTKKLIITHNQTDHYCYDVAFESGNAYAIMGPSGCGKSTLLDLLAGFIQAQSGKIELNGAELKTQAVHERDMSIMLQDHNLFAHLTVQQNLDLCFKNSTIKRSKTEKLAQIKQELEWLGLDVSMLKRLPGELSGGQQQRIALLRNILLDRKILLLDEPFSGLDDKTRNLAHKRLINWLNSERLIILVSHDIEDAQALNAINLNITDICQKT
jgi:thiamine transport system ATP-binding protein